MKLKLENVSVRFQVLRQIDYNLKATLANSVRRKKSSKHFVKALSDVSFAAKDGERVGVLGANGSGKTTLLRVAAGVLPPTTGTVSLVSNTLNLLGDSGSNLNPEISGRENLKELALIHGMTWSEANQQLLQLEQLTGLGDRVLDPVYSYSAGMQARVRLAILFQQHPDLIVLDEGIGLTDRKFTQQNGIHLNQLIESTPIVLIASHSEELILRYCNRAVLLQNGLIVEDGLPTSVLAKYHAITSTG